MTRAAPPYTVPLSDAVQNLKKGRSVNTLTQTPVSPAAPQAATPYFSREAEFDRAVSDEEARRGVTPEPRAA
jgi:hypothetical protein